MQNTTVAAVFADSRAVTGADVLEAFPPTPTAKEHWWVYFGTIKPARIELQPTPETVLPGIEHTLATAIEDGKTDTVGWQ
jgi:hypothetical protein